METDEHTLLQMQCVEAIKKLDENNVVLLLKILENWKKVGNAGD